MKISTRNPLSIFTSLIMALTLSGCISLAAEAPPSLLVLKAENTVAEGTLRSGPASTALVVLQPAVPRKLETTRVPVQISASSIAYLTDAIWADKPADLFRELLIETIAAQNDRLVLNNSDAAGQEDEQLSGSLHEFGIEEDTLEAVIVYDAVQLRGGEPIRKKRFEIRESLIEIGAVQAGDALNKAANRLAEQVAKWIG